MAIASGGSLGTGTNSQNNSGFSFNTAINTMAAGDFAILTISTDNTSTVDGDNNEHTSVSGGTGTWTKLGEYTNSNGAAAAGITVSVWLFEASGSVPVGTSITLSFASNRTDKACNFWKYTKAAGTVIVKDTEPASNPITNQVDASAGFGSVAFSGLSSASRLYFRGMGKEANTTSAITQSANFTPIGNARSRNNTNAVTVYAEFRINTSTGETSNPTLAVTGDTASLFLALEEAIAPATADLTATDPVETLEGEVAQIEVTAALDATDPNETLDGTAQVALEAALDAADPDDTLTATGTAADPGHTADLDATDPNETLDATGSISVTAEASPTDPVETLSGEATAAVSAAGTPTDPDDQIAATGSLQVTGEGSATDPVETLSGEASLSVDLTADLSATDPVETLSGTATATAPDLTADASITDPGETLSGTADVVTLTGSLDTTDPVEQMMAEGAAAVEIDFSGSDPSETVSAFSQVTVEAAGQSNEPAEELFSGATVETLNFMLETTDDIETLDALIALSPVNILEEMLGDASMTTATLNLTTMLEAVNAILASVGESPVSSIDGQFVDATIAQNLLIEEMRAVQNRGWNWNTDKEMSFAPDGAGYIRLPRNILRIVFEDKNLVARGLLLYDRENHTYNFTEAVTAAEVVTLLPFEGMPEALRRFCTIRAGRRFQDRLQSDQVLHEFQRTDELTAWAAAINDEAEVAGWNLVANDRLIQRMKSYR
jgi:hypothetical protein